MFQSNFLDTLKVFNEGNSFEAYQFMGCVRTHESGQDGFRFTVWAPRAKNVFLVGDFNNWEKESMYPVFESGVYTLFKNNVYDNQAYKYAIETQEGQIVYKIDPFAHRFETPPKDASLVYDDPGFHWHDDTYLKNRNKGPVNIYEVHLSSWKKHYDGTNYSFDDLIESLLPYVKEMGYTHIELMPVMDHPLDASWGYQITGYFAVGGRFGDPQGLKRFVNAAHGMGLGVILDWVPGHFSQNYDAIAYFDGTPTFESDNPIMAKNLRWGAHNFDLGKTQVQSFLISSAFYWLKEFHVDGIRVDAVSNMLYLDYDLEPHVLNEDGSNTHHAGIAFLRKLNNTIHKTFGNVMMIAEESTSWDGITKPPSEGGLGFDYKWNMGWMNDTLRFFEMDPIYRNHHMDLLTFVFVYMRHEKYILALSHDEVVHGKRSLLDKMPGNRYNQFAQLKLLNAWMMAVVGKKLNFMGNEIGQYLEWRFYEELEWNALTNEYNKEYQYFIKVMNGLYRTEAAFYEDDMEVLWVREENAMMFIKRKDFYILMNFIPHQHDAYTLEVKENGIYDVVVNSEMVEFGGNWTYQVSTYETVDKRIELVVPAYGVLVLKKRR